jgi:hypothetical protein
MISEAGRVCRLFATDCRHLAISAAGFSGEFCSRNFSQLAAGLTWPGEQRHKLLDTFFTQNFPS